MEFALVMGLVVTLFLALVEFGFLLDEELAIAAAARSGARLAAVEGGDTARVREAIAEELAGFGVDPEGVTVAISPHRAIYGTQVTVALAHEYAFRTPLFERLGLGPLELRATAVARSEKLASP
ncbi:MAG: pilus assembly protein [Clostridia bacterium]|nr:pilus assembly protein [Clostridia bacterium]